jgi:hypothetical protein
METFPPRLHGPAQGGFFSTNYQHLTKHGKDIGRFMKLFSLPLLGRMMALGAFAIHATAFSAAAGTNGNGVGPSDVGIWYCTYYPTVWTNVIGYTRAGTYLPLCSDKTNDFRNYASDDIKVIDYHLQQLAEARIDFVALELSPGGLGGYRKTDIYNYMVGCGRKTCERIAVWNKTHSWKIKYALGVGVHEDCRGNDSWGLAIEKVAEDVAKTFLNNPNYGGPDDYYHLNGKPLLICYGLRLPQLIQEWAGYKGEKIYGDQFTLRTFTGYAAAGEYGWPLPLHQGTLLHPEIELVQPGFNVHRPNEIERRNGGDFYRACWEKVLQNKKPQIVMIQAFNDYLEESAVWTTDTRHLETDQEKWLGHDGQLHPAMYWELTKEYIGRLRKEVVPAAKTVTPTDAGVK